MNGVANAIGEVTHLIPVRGTEVEVTNITHFLYYGGVTNICLQTIDTYILRSRHLRYRDG